MNAFTVVEQFENRIAEFCGARHCVAVSTGTAAIFLSLMYERERLQADAPPPIVVSCPARTFVSVPMAILQAGFHLSFNEYPWQEKVGYYLLSPTRVVDSALRFHEGCYVGGLQCLSFQARKILNIGEGGAVITDDGDAAEWLRAARYSGRSAADGFDVQKIKMMGWQLYMTPEKAGRGLQLMEYKRDLRNLPREAFDYPDLREAPFFKVARTEQSAATAQDDAWHCPLHHPAWCSCPQPKEPSHDEIIRRSQRLVDAVDGEFWKDAIVQWPSRFLHTRDCNVHSPTLRPCSCLLETRLKAEILRLHRAALAPSSTTATAKIAEYRESFKEADTITSEWIRLLEGDAIVIPPPEITRKQLLRVAKDFQTMYFAVVTHDQVVEDKNNTIDRLHAELEAARQAPSATGRISNAAFSKREAENIVNSADAQCFRWLLKHHSGSEKGRCFIGGVEFKGEDVRDAITDAIEREETSSTDRETNK